MQNTANDIIKTIKTLPIREKAKVYEWLDEEKREISQKIRANENAKDQIERFKKAQEWIRVNRKEFMNQWICLEGDKLIAHGEDALEVHNKALEAEIETPFLEHIVDESDWGGW